MGNYNPGRFSFDLAAPDPYAPPMNCMAGGLTPAQQTTLRNAFAAAPAKVQQEICNISNIVVHTDNYAWGFWENPLTKPTGQAPNSYIGIRAADFTSTLAQEEDAVDAQVLLRHAASLRFSNTSNGDASFGLLAVIAHEIGHVIWHRDGIISKLPCFNEEFITNPTKGQKSWKRDSNLVQIMARYWHPPPSDDRAAGSAEHENNVPHPIRHPPTTAAQVKAIMTNGFVTPFAAISPEEDFVETYKLLALSTKNGALELTLHVTHPGDDGDRADITLLPTTPLTHPSTQAKRGCVNTLMQ